jgi:hypothetical protein
MIAGGHKPVPAVQGLPRQRRERVGFGRQPVSPLTLFRQMFEQVDDEG